MQLLFFLAFLGAGIGVVGQCAYVTVRSLLLLARHWPTLFQCGMACLKQAWLRRLPPPSAQITPVSEPDWQALEVPTAFRKGTMIW